MADPLNKSKTDIPEISFPMFPSIEEHEARIRRIWRISQAIGFGTVALAVVLVFALLRFGVPVSSISIIVPIAMICGVFLFGVAFAIPTGLTSLLRMALMVQMSYESMSMARHTTLTVRDLKKSSGPVLQDLRAIIDQLKPVAEVANRQAQDGYLEKIESHLKTIADRVKRDTTPVPVRQRPTTEG